jgi:UDP-glucose 4-epimerase
MKILVTGASGYIGSQVCKALSQYHNIVAVDRNIVKHKYFDEYYNYDYGSLEVQKLLLTIDAVVHIGATSLVGPSVLDPSKYYNNNVARTLELLDACKAQGVKRFVFASSAATYGEPTEDVCLESGQHEPVNPYGWSKRITEIMLKDYAKAYGINSVSCRFFNVAGADLDEEFGQEKQATHIIARIMEQAIAGKEFTLNGNDFDTPDGTCVRDYIHVADVAKGISLAVDFTENNAGAFVFNMGNGEGYSNMDIVNAVKEHTPLVPNIKIGPARAGDPAKLIADSALANNTLKWKPQYGLDTIVKTAYNWYIKTNKNKTSTS